MTDVRDFALSMFLMSIETMLLMASLHSVFPRRRLRRGNLAVAALFATSFQLYAYLRHQYTLEGVATLQVMDYLLSLVFFQASIWQRVAYQAAFEFILLGCDFFALAVGGLVLPYDFTMYAENSAGEMVLVLLSKGLATLLASVCFRRRKLRLPSENDPRRYHAIIPPVIFIAGLYMGFLLWRDGRWLRTETAVVIVLAFGTINYLILRLNTVAGEVRELESELQTYASVHKGWLQRVEAGITGVRKMHHDMRKHLVALMAALRRGQPREAERYLETLEESLNDLLPQGFTGNDVIDAVLSDALGTCERKGLSLQCHGTVPPDLSADPVDLTRIMGNLLDNAVNASPHGSTLTVHCSFRSGTLIVSVKNQVDPARQGQGEGLGKAILLETAQKYDGWIEEQSSHGSYGVVIGISVQ